MHLDGARLWNAAVATGESEARLAASATTVMSCLSKGLAAPVGSLLAGPSEVIDRARHERKRLGGSMRQAGIVAAAGLVAIDTMVDRLADDHERASVLAHAVAERWPGVLDPQAVRTNVVVFPHADADALLAHLERRGILAGTLAPGIVRLMTHLGVTDDGLAQAVATLADAP
jgi:threonine aldolase